MVATNVPIPIEAIERFCRAWKVTEFALFGSVLRTDFGPSSDVDVLVTFAPDAPWSYWEWPTMTEELESIFGRRVDLVERASLSNPFRRHEILSHHRVVYAA